MQSEGEAASLERNAIGKLAGWVGILCNFLLAAGKMMVGHSTASMSILADGLNNLSDAASSIVTLLGFKLAEKPADKEHPYGHARFEYLAGLTVAVMILVVGMELGKSSVHKILHPSPVEFSTLIVYVLVGSMLVKGGMMLFYQRMGQKIQSTALYAAADDSRNDVLTTGAVLLAALAEHFFHWQADGMMGMFVALFILCNGVKLAKETVSPLLGEGGSSTLRRQLIDYIDACPMVLGCHDLLIHDYGPERRYASVHVEIDKNQEPLACHEVIDHIERACLKEYGVHLVIHYDPVATDDQEAIELQKKVMRLLKTKDNRLTLHDFRVLPLQEKGVTELEFDVMLPEDLRGQEEVIQHLLEEGLNRSGEKKYCTDIVFDIETDDLLQG